MLHGVYSSRIPAQVTLQADEATGSCRQTKESHRDGYRPPCTRGETTGMIRMLAASL